MACSPLPSLFLCSTFAFRRTALSGTCLRGWWNWLLGLLVSLISFVVIGGAWGSHQCMLGQIRRGAGLLYGSISCHFFSSRFYPRHRLFSGVFQAPFSPSCASPRMCSSSR